MTLAEQVLQAASAQNASITIAESCTGGMLTSALTELPGASMILDSGFIPYSYASKIAVLGVSPDTLLEKGAVSEEVAVQMAQGALKASSATHAIAITGVAGPQDSEAKPAGTVWFCVATSENTHTELVEFGALGRQNVRQSSVDHALTMMLNVFIVPII